jgi:hypothetical protein
MLNLSKNHVNLIHIGLVAPLLYYVTTTQNIDPKIWTGMMVLAGAVLLYHGNNIYKGKLENQSQRKNVAIAHIAVVAPLLYYVASKQGNLNPQHLEYVKYLAIAIAGFHGYKYYERNRGT